VKGELALTEFCRSFSNDIERKKASQKRKFS
jgi:hypothetical protein